MIGFLDKSREEQIEWRKTQAKPCLDNGACLYCGCETPERFYSDEGCEDPVKRCFPDMMDNLKWNEFKIKNNIK